MFVFCMSECKWLVPKLSESSYFVLTHALCRMLMLCELSCTSCWVVVIKMLGYEGCLGFSGLLTNQNVVLLTNLKKMASALLCPPLLYSLAENKPLLYVCKKMPAMCQAGGSRKRLSSYPTWSKGVIHLNLQSTLANSPADWHLETFCLRWSILKSHLVNHLGYGAQWIDFIESDLLKKYMGQVLDLMRC